MLCGLLSVAGGWGFMWLVCFCFLADMWRRGQYAFFTDTAQAAIAFSFFSLLTFVSMDVGRVIKVRYTLRFMTFMTGNDLYV